MFLNQVVLIVVSNRVHEVSDICYVESQLSTSSGTIFLISNCFIALGGGGSRNKAQYLL
jgi:hypothetical protein